jgi:3-phytase
MDASVIVEPGKTIYNLDFMTQTIIPTGSIPEAKGGMVNEKDTVFRGLLGVNYNTSNNRFYAISDDRF